MGGDELSYTGAKGACYVREDTCKETCRCHPACPMRFPASELDDGEHADEDEALIQNADDCDIIRARERRRGAVVFLETAVGKREACVLRG